MDEIKQRQAIQEFVEKWTGRGQEDEDDRPFWLDILERVLGVEDATDHIQFQKKVHLKDGTTKRIDTYIPETKVLIEQKSLGLDLDRSYFRSGIEMHGTFDQANLYNNGLINSEKQNIEK